MCAARKGQVATMRILIENGADVNANGVYTPLCMAVYAGCKQAVELLLSQSANPNLRISEGPRQGLTALHESIIEGNKECMSLLVKYGADPMLTTPEGENAKELAILWHRESLLPLL